MFLAPGARLGPYEVLSAIGAGGMGEVYKARDTRLDRTVAIKVLPAQVASDPDLRQRFEREARAVAALNHPHICTLYDVGHQDGIDFLVMEYLEGQTLAERLEKGALPLEQALQYAIQVADALDKAHRQGITHRDLKPGNIMVTKSGAKLMDFGLAKFAPAAPAGMAGLTVAATLSAPLTVQGTILGTLHYMAPEQVEGKDADARSDIFSFGAILHEMVTGKRAFEGKSAASVIAAILEREPPAVSTLQPMSPPSLDRLLKRCLAKNPDDRWDTAHDLTGELRWVLEEPARIQTMHSGPRMWRRLGSFAAVAIALAGAGLAGWALKPSPAARPLPVTRFTVALPATQRLTPAGRWGLALAPDGAMLVYVANNQLYLRFMDRQDAQPLPGTENAKSPFFSPDGQWVGFVGGPNTNQLKRVAINGGAPITICDLPGNVFGAHWETDDTILYGYYGGIWKVSAAGGVPERLIALDAAKNEWAADPQLLAGGTAILFRTGVGRSPSDFAVTGQIVAQPLPSGSRRVLIDRSLRAMALPTGHLLYAQETSLLAVPFDAVRLEVTGGPVPLTDGIFPGQFTVAGDQALAFVPRSITIAVEGMLAWVDRGGRVTPFPQPRAPLSTPRVSPDGRRVAVGLGQSARLLRAEGARCAARYLDAADDGRTKAGAVSGDAVQRTLADVLPGRTLARLRVGRIGPR